MAAIQNAYGGSDPYFNKVVALLHMDGADGDQFFPDVTGQQFTTAAGTGAKIVVDPNGSGYSAASFDATTDSMISGPKYLEQYRLHGDFTMEAYVKQTARDTVSPIISMGVTWGDTGMIMYINGNGFLDASSGGVNYLIGNIVVPLNQRTHVAVTRKGGVIKAWVGGQFAGSINAATDFTDGILEIGGAEPTAYRFKGLIDEVRVTNGIARYDMPFDPPGPFPNQ
jgi:hypothetical protein